MEITELVINWNKFAMEKLQTGSEEESFRLLKVAEETIINNP